MTRILIPIVSILLSAFVQLLNFKKENKIVSILGFAIAFLGAMLFWMPLFNAGYTGGWGHVGAFLRDGVDLVQAGEATKAGRNIFIFGQCAIFACLSMVLAACAFVVVKAIKSKRKSK